MNPAESIRVASEAFDLLFANDLTGAVDLFDADRYHDSPFHLMGLGVCSLLKAAFGTNEPKFIEEATRCLELSQGEARKYMKSAKYCAPSHTFTPGLEWEVLHTDSVLFLGLTHALSESYRGYIRCVYELNSAHSKFTRLFQILYPKGLDEHLTSGHAPTPIHKRLSHDTHYPAAHPGLWARPSGFLAWWKFAPPAPTPSMLCADNTPSNDAIEDLILSGVAFGESLPRHTDLAMQLVFELAWLLLGCKRYEESAEVFIRLMKMNSWSHATYLFTAAGCYVSCGRLDEAQSLLDRIPQCTNKRRWMMATQIYIQKKLEFYKKKQIRRGGDPDRYVEAIRISPADEFAIFWNTYSHIDEATALAHIESLDAFTPPVGIESQHMRGRPVPPTDTTLDLDTADELAVRSLILGIVHRTLGDYVGTRALLNDALKHGANVEVSTWVSAVAYFELAVLEMKEGDTKAAELVRADRKEKKKRMDMWGDTFKAAREMLTEATTMCTRGVDLSSRLDSRILMLREEIHKKMKTVGYE